MKRAPIQNTDPATFFYRNSRAMVLIIGLVVVSGLTSLAVLPRMEDPVIGQRGGLVSTALAGADARRVEVLVTEPLEDRLQEIEAIKKLTSQSRPGISTIQIELRENIVDTNEVWSEVRSKLDDAVVALPDQAGKPVFDEIDVRAYALIVAVCWESETPVNWAILRRLAKRLEDVLQAVPGTEVVDRFADPGEQITVEIDPELAAELGLNAREVAEAINQSDAKNASGIVRGDGRDMVIEMFNQFRQADRIGESLVRSGSDGEMVRLADISTIRRGVPDPLPTLGSVDGRPAVSLGVLVRPRERLDHWRPQAQAALEDFQRFLPSGITIDIPLDQSEYVNLRLSSLALNLIFGAIAVVLVVWGLMGWRNAVVVALSLPLSTLTVLFGLRVLDVPIHQMSVTGMIIALGLLIDNAIVAVDEVTSSIRRGSTRIAAVREMVHHLAIPLAGSTATTALAFAPIAMMPGNAGEFVGSIAISVIIAISASLFFALTVIPVVAARFVVTRPESQTVSRLAGLMERGITSDRLLDGYRRTLQFMLRRPYRGMLVGLALPAIGFTVAPRLPEQFFPPADRDQFHIQLELPVDASIQATKQAADRLNALVADAGAVKVSWYFGESAPMFYYNVLNNRRGVPNFANAIVQMENARGIGEVLRRLQAEADRLVPQARVLFRQLEQGPPFDAPIEVRLFGPDIDRLQQLGDQIRLALAAAENVTHTVAQLNETLPTATYDVREADARLVGMTPEKVSEQLFDLLEGVPAGSVLEDTEQIPVHVRVGGTRRESLQAIGSLQLHAGDFRFPVESLADVRLEPEIAVIPRLNRRRMNLISGFVSAGSLPSVAIKDFERRLSQGGFQLPTGYELQYGGEASRRDDAVGNLMANVGVLAVMMVAVLVLSFGSFRLAAMILIVAACSGGLGLLALWIGGYPFGFMAIIGIMGLIGVAINDSIVVLAALQSRTNAGNDGLEKTVETVIGSTRHVIATTFTTIAGFTPLILNGGQFWPPLAIAIAGGVGGATLLALLFIPAMYRWVAVGDHVPVNADGETSQSTSERLRLAT